MHHLVASKMGRAFVIAAVSCMVRASIAALDTPHEQLEGMPDKTLSELISAPQSQLFVLQHIFMKVRVDASHLIVRDATLCFLTFQHTHGFTSLAHISRLL